MLMADEQSEEDMRYKLMQESVWSIDDRLNQILEHVISHEAELLSVRRWLDQFRQQVFSLWGVDQSTSSG